ncbi:hypothetical protein GW17_00020029 [Ensete ventricosum]|nr:hypothetical protein GW17_00020029 [Ensete ventricosum]
MHRCCSRAVAARGSPAPHRHPRVAGALSLVRGERSRRPEVSPRSRAGNSLLLSCLVSQSGEGRLPAKNHTRATDRVENQGRAGISLFSAFSSSPSSSFSLNRPPTVEINRRRSISMVPLDSGRFAYWYLVGPVCTAHTQCVSPSEDATTIGKKLTEEEKSTFKTKLEEYKEILSKSPEDSTALESLVSNVQERPNNADAYRLLGDVKFELKDYDGSASAYKNYLSVSTSLSIITKIRLLVSLTSKFFVGLQTHCWLPINLTRFAVQELLKYREQLNEKYSRGSNVYVDGKVNLDKENLNADPIQVSP